MQSQLAEEKNKLADLNEQLQQENSQKEQELKETEERHHSQISGFQKKIVDLVSIVGQSLLRYLFVSVTQKRARPYSTFSGLLFALCPKGLDRDRKNGICTF